MAESDPHALFMTAVADHGAGRWDAAEQGYHKVLALRPDTAAAWGNLGLLLAKTGRPDEALAALEAAAQIRPDHAKAHFDLGNLLAELGEAERAAAAYGRAIACDPDDTDARYNLGLLSAEGGDTPAAIAQFRAVLARTPGHVGAINNLGLLLSENGEADTALSLFDQALKSTPDDPTLLYGRAHALNRLDRLDEALAEYKAAALADPENLDAVAQAVHLMQRLCAWDELSAWLPRMAAGTDAALSRGRRPGETPFMSLTLFSDPARHLAVARAYTAEIERHISPLPPPSPQAEGGRIKIGYLSGNFSDHPTAYNTAGLIAAHDRSRFEIFVYSYGRDDQSRIRKRIAADADRFVDLSDQSARAAAERIRADGVEIMIGLMGHTSGSRLEIAAYHPAPIQVAYLTFPGSIGGGLFDYVLVDEIVCPRPECHLFDEAPVWLPDSYWPVDDRTPPPPPPPPRDALGLPDEGVVFASFNQAHKIGPDVFALWVEIVKDTPNSVLWLLGGHQTAEKHLLGAAEALGLDPARIVFARHLPRPDHLARLGAADVVLDTLTYGGHTTTLDALSAHVPVVTRRGGHFASRVSASLLCAAGMPELVASDLDGYRRLAGSLARDPARRAEVRARLVQSRDRAPLFDTARTTRNLERAFAVMATRRRGGEAPTPIPFDPLV